MLFESGVIEFRYLRVPPAPITGQWPQGVAGIASGAPLRVYAAAWPVRLLGPTTVRFTPR